MMMSTECSSYTDTIKSFWSELDLIESCDGRGASSPTVSSDDLSADEIPPTGSESSSPWLMPEIQFFKEIGLIDEKHCKSDSSLDLSSLDDIVSSLPLTKAQKNTIGKRISSLRKKGLRKSPTKSRPDVRSVFPQPSQNERQQLGVNQEHNGRRRKDANLHRRLSEENKEVKCTHDELPKSEKHSRLLPWSSFNKAYKVKGAEVRPTQTFENEGVQIISIKQLSTLSRLKGQRIEKILRVQQGLKAINRNSKPNEAIKEECTKITEDQLGVTIEKGKEPGSYMVFLSTSEDFMAVEDIAAHKVLYNRLRTLAILELTSILDSFGLEYEKVALQRSTKLKRRKYDGILFGVPLEELLESDRRKFCWMEPIPFILKSVIEYIRKNGLTEDGVLRVAGSQSKVHLLRTEIEKGYTMATIETKEAIMASIFASYTINEVVGVLKLFIRELPDHLLPINFTEIFLHVPKIPEFLVQLQVLNLLTLLTGIHQRSSLMEILFLLGEISLKCENNRMNTNNIATVMAPNLFPSFVKSTKNFMLSKKTDLKDFEHINSVEVTRALNSCVVTKMLIDYQNVLFHIPPYLLDQLTEEAGS